MLSNDLKKLFSWLALFVQLSSNTTNLFTELKQRGHAIHLMLVPRTLWWTQTAETEIAQITDKYKIWYHQERPHTQSLLAKITSAIDDTDISYIAQIGILFDLYQYATFFYLGGTFSTIGGHNVLEPAAWHLPIIIGPSLAHANVMARSLLAAQGAHQVHTQEELITITHHLLSTPQKQQLVRTRAHRWLKQQHHASRITIDRIIQTL